MFGVPHGRRQHYQYKIDGTAIIAQAMYVLEATKLHTPVDDDAEWGIDLKITCNDQILSVGGDSKIVANIVVKNLIMH